MYPLVYLFLVFLMILRNSTARFSSKFDNEIANQQKCNFTSREEALRKIIPESYRKLPEKFSNFVNISVFVRVIFLNFFEMDEQHATIKSNLYFFREYHEPRFAEVGCIHPPMGLFLQEMDMVWLPPVGISVMLKRGNPITPVDERMLLIKSPGTFNCICLPEQT